MVMINELFHPPIEPRVSGKCVYPLTSSVSRVKNITNRLLAADSEKMGLGPHGEVGGRVEECSPMSILGGTISNNRVQ